MKPSNKKDPLSRNVLKASAVCPDCEDCSDFAKWVYPNYYPDGLVCRECGHACFRDDLLIVITESLETY